MGSGISRQQVETQERINLLKEDLSHWVDGNKNKDAALELSKKIQKAFKYGDTSLSIACEFLSAGEMVEILTHVDNLPPHIFNSSVFPHLKNIELTGSDKILDSENKVKIYIYDDYKLCDNTNINRTHQIESDILVVLDTAVAASEEGELYQTKNLYSY